MADALTIEADSYPDSERGGLLREPIRQWRGQIEVRPGVMLGKPVCAGTRITVEHVLLELGGGLSEADLLAQHPRLTPDHIRAALLYAADLIASKRVA